MTFTKHIIILSLALFVMPSSYAWASDPVSADVPVIQDVRPDNTLMRAENSASDLLKQLGRMIFALVIVLALMLVIFKLLLPRLIQPMHRAKHMQIVDQLALDQSKRLCIVRVGERLQLLGLSENGIQRLGRIDGELAELEAASTPATSQTSVLGQWIQQQVGKFKGSRKS